MRTKKVFYRPRLPDKFAKTKNKIRSNICCSNSIILKWISSCEINRSICFKNRIFKTGIIYLLFGKYFFLFEKIILRNDGILEKILYCDDGILVNNHIFHLTWNLKRYFKIIQNDIYVHYSFIPTRFYWDMSRFYTECYDSPILGWHLWPF